MDKMLYEYIQNLKRNYTNWDLMDFCKYTGLRPDAYGVTKFKQFHTIVNLISEFDDTNLEILFSDYRTAEGGPSQSPKPGG
jgi:hypothetical protein